MRRVAIYPGAFDPITLGHLSIVNRSLRVVDDLIIAVAHDSIKKTSFSVEQRCAMIERDIAKYLDYRAYQRVVIKDFKGLLIDFAPQQNAKLIIRGLRTVSDLEYEFQLFSANAKLAPEIETLFLPATDAACFISSTIVKEIARLGGDISKFVSEQTAQTLKQHFQQ